MYRADLECWPENGWALFRLSQCLRSRGAAAEAREVDARFATTWAPADVKLDKTCLCLHKKTSRSRSVAGAAAIAIFVQLLLRSRRQGAATRDEHPRRVC